jgi:hypothetical protein
MLKNKDMEDIKNNKTCMHTIESNSDLSLVDANKYKSRIGK